MKRIRLAMVVSLLCLVSFATSASAECAWIVWEQTLGEKFAGLPPNDLWRPVASHDKKQDCDVEALQELKRAGKADSPYRAFYVCLPDTVDPRGPKGK